MFNHLWLDWLFGRFTFDKNFLLYFELPPRIFFRQTLLYSMLMAASANSAASSPIAAAGQLPNQNGNIAAMFAAQPSIHAASHEHDIQMWLMKAAKDKGVDITAPKAPGPKATPAMKRAYEKAMEEHEDKLMDLQVHAAILQSQVRGNSLWRSYFCTYFLPQESEKARKRRRDDELNSLEEFGSLFLTRFFRQVSLHRVRVRAVACLKASVCSRFFAGGAGT